jgi:hypothetical protein
VVTAATTVSRLRWADGFAPQVRIGIHADDASSSDDGYRGRGVHVAARLGAEASGGEILASAGTLDEAGLEVETGQPRTALMKGVSEPMTLGWASCWSGQRQENPQRPSRPWGVQLGVRGATGHIAQRIRLRS